MEEWGSEGVGGLWRSRRAGERDAGEPVGVSPRTGRLATKSSSCTRQSAGRPRSGERSYAQSPGADAARLACVVGEWVSHPDAQRSTLNAPPPMKETAPEGIRHRFCERREGKWGGKLAEGKGGRGEGSDLVGIIVSRCADHRPVVRVSTAPGTGHPGLWGTTCSATDSQPPRCARWRSAERAVRSRTACGPSSRPCRSRPRTPGPGG